MTADIVLPPHPHKLVCPICGLTREMPDGWQAMLGAPVLKCRADDIAMIDLSAIPTVDGWHHDWDVERDGPAILTFDPPYTDESGEVWTKALNYSWGNYRNMS